jgi:hypothetical protein
MWAEAYKCTIYMQLKIVQNGSIKIPLLHVSQHAVTV